MDDVRCHSLQQPGAPQPPGELLQRAPQPPGGLLQRAPSHRCCFLGLETSPELLWEDWELGKSFTKTLVLKNVHGRLQKLRLRAPVSKYFRTVPTQKILISPGTSYSLPLTFSPHARCEYEDSIAFDGREGSFEVFLRATLPRHALLAPDSVLLPLCALQHSTQTTLVLKNTGKLHTWFQWECPPPFQMCPHQGLLQPGQETLITVVFRPQEALLYQREAFCRFGNAGEELPGRCTVLLQGPAKHPSLQLRCGEEEPTASTELFFGSVAIGCHRKKHFTICNLSPVTASFAVSGLRGATPQLGSEFSCNVSSGEVAPGASLRATVTYSPVVVDTVAVDYLTVTCPGALNRTQLKLTGSSTGPSVTLSCSVLDFGHIQEGGEVVRSVDLVNSSPSEAVYQWDLDVRGHSVFSIQPAEGTLQPDSRVTLKVVYVPRSPMIHHRRVACLVLHQDPVFLDVIGTCHSELQQPMVLRPKHLTTYRLHRRHGLTHYPPDRLSAMLQNHRLRLDRQGALSLLEEESREQSPESHDLLSENSLMDEYYQAASGGLSPFSSSSPDPSSSSPSSSSSHVTVKPAELVFSCAPSSSSQSVCITNRTKGTVSLVWTTAPDSPFAVTPVSCDLSPLKSTSFGVTYDPKELNTLHGAQLECFAIYKVLREPGQVEEGLLFPSWCVTVRVIGHSFQLGREHFVPNCTLQQPTVVFPALSLLSYRTVLLRNTGDLPLSFNLHPRQASAQAASVSVVPGCGLVLPGRHQVLHLRTTPSEDGPRQGFSVTLQLNGAQYTQEMRVFSWVEQPSVAMEAEGCLHLQPTAVGSSSQRGHCIRNPSRVALGFQWRIPEEDRKVISVEPESGELQPNDSMVQTWSFSPLEVTTYQLTPSITFWPLQAPEGETSRLGLEVTAMGCQGTIQAESAVVQLGEMQVGGCRTVEVPLVNSSLCPLSVGLAVQQTLLDQQLASNPCTEPLALQLEASRRTIPSCSRVLLTCTVTPHRRAHYQWTISYQPLSATGGELGAPSVLCELRGEGVFPTLQVADARCGGSVGGLSKGQLWRLFSLDSLNSHLLSCPSPRELTHRKPTRHSLHRCPSVFTAAILDFNFSSAPVASEPSSVVLLLDNSGSIPAAWAFLFPEDQKLEMNHWAESGEFSSTELHQMKVQDNRLFSISPRSGVLSPGQQRAVSFTYRHNLAGAHRLPVVFKLSHGREILLNFQGMTVERDRPYLHFSCPLHVFTPVAVGAMSPPRQVYELYNGSAVVVHYEVDLSPLQQLQEQNFDHPVLCCLDPQGEVRPGRTARLEWVFSPLEAKLYNVAIVIHVRGGDSTTVSFQGCGFDPRAPHSLAPDYLPEGRQSIPPVQKAALPGQVVFLSEEMVSLGDIPVHSRPTRILFLTNVSHTEAVQYAWEPQDSPQVLQMKPDKGRLGPGESILCVLTLTTTGCAVIYQLDLICQITMETELLEYQESVRRWEEEKQRQQHEFTITERDLGGGGEGEGGGGQASQVPRTASAEAPPPRRKYKVTAGSAPSLDPLMKLKKCEISPSSSSSSSSSEVGGLPSSRPPRGGRRVQREAWRRHPEHSMPTPTLLHLGVTARSHTLLDYQALFTDTLNQHYVYSSHASASSTVPPTAVLLPLIPGPETDILTHTVLSLIRSLLNDPDLPRRLAGDAPERIPYFSQLRAPGLPGSASPAAPPPRPSSTPAFPCRPRGLRPAGAGVSLRERPGTVAAAGGTPGGTPDPGGHSGQPDDRTGPGPGGLRHSVRRCAEFSDVCEDVLLNTLQNLMMEAFRGEVELTAPPPSSQDSTLLPRSPPGELVHEGRCQQ